MKPSPAAVTLLMCDIVESTALTNRLGDLKSAHLFEQFDWAARNLLHVHDGREIDRTDGFFLLFYRVEAAVRYAEDLHAALEQISRKQGEKIGARIGIHFAEVYLRYNPEQHVARGAKPIEVEGLAKPVTARIMNLATGRQTLISAEAVGMARRAIHDHVDAETWIWASYGEYPLKGIGAPVSIWEVGKRHRAPMQRPAVASPKGPYGRRLALMAVAVSLWLIAGFGFFAFAYPLRHPEVDSCRLYLEGEFETINRGYIVLENGGSYIADVEGSLLEFECLPEGTKVSAVLELGGKDEMIVHVPNITLGAASGTTTISLADARDGLPPNFQIPSESPYPDMPASLPQQRDVTTVDESASTIQVEPVVEPVVPNASTEMSVQVQPSLNNRTTCKPFSSKRCTVNASNAFGSCEIIGKQTCEKNGKWSGCFGSCGFINYGKKDATCCTIISSHEDVPQYDPKTGEYRMVTVPQERKQQYKCKVDCAIAYHCEKDSSSDARCTATTPVTCAAPARCQ
jgi:class 3 adenylate cyclase